MSMSLLQKLWPLPGTDLFSALSHQIPKGHNTVKALRNQPVKEGLIDILPVADARYV